jgi:magnesium transporter
MSGAAGSDQPVRSAVPLADLSTIDAALAKDDAALREAVKRVRPADLGRDLSRRSLDQGGRVLRAIDDRHGAAMLQAAHAGVAGKLLSGADPTRSARMLAFMPIDHQVAILAKVEREPRDAIEASMEPDDKTAVGRLLAYPAGAVGRLMTPKIWRCEVAQTAGDAMTALRSGQGEIEVAVNLYVVDAGKLVGVAALREVAVAPPETPIADVMTRDPIAVGEHVGRGDAADIIRTHDFLSLPVVDRGGKLVGAVRVDDLLDAALENVGTAFLNQGAVAGAVAAQEPYFQSSIARVVRSRITWLILLFVAETATGTVLRYFEDELAKVTALSFFVPLLIGTGGNAGSQTVSTVIRAAALGEARFRDIGRVVLREVSAGVLLGLLLGTIAFGRALLWGVDYDLAFCVAVTILVVCTWANAVGATIPLIAQRFGVDPTVVSAPLITTLVDASGLFIYFSTAHVMIAALR